MVTSHILHLLVKLFEGVAATKLLDFLGTTAMFVFVDI